MCYIQKEAVTVMPTTVSCGLLFLSLVIYGVKMSQEAHLGLPAVWQMIKQVYIDHTPCPEFIKRQLV
jgi:hypothetical protein